MIFDYIIINPPYQRTGGGRVLKEALRNSKYIISLSPVCINLKTFENIESVESVDVDGFDADLTNLCIFRLNKKKVFKFTYDQLLFLSFDKRYIKFYETNSKLKHTIKTGEAKVAQQEYIESNKDRFVVSNLRITKTGFTKTGYTHSFIDPNYKLSSKKSRPFSLGLCYVEFPNKKARDNFYTFVMNSELQNNLLFGLNKGSGIFDVAIPRIDWERVSNSELWEKKDYDKAVLSAMNLKIVNGVIENV